MSSTQSIPLSRILARIVPTEAQPVRSTARIIALDAAQVPYRVVRSSSEPKEYFDDDVNHDFLPSELNDGYDEVRCYMPLVNAPKLTNMAGSTVAVALWNHITVPSRQQNYSDLCSKLEEEVIELVEQLPVPNLLSNLIKECITEVGNELSSWALYYYNTTFYDTQWGNSLFNLISKIIWRSDGIIDKLQTAKNILTFGNLTDVEKFYLSCTYCLKDELISIWPSVSHNTTLNCTESRFYNRVFRSYWRHWFGKEMSARYSDSNMFKNSCVDNWPAMEYFFDRMTCQEQMENTIAFIDRNERSNYQKLLLMKLDDTQKTQVYAERIVRIVSNYSKSRVDVREIYSIWPQVRDTLTFDDFVGIYKCLFESRFVGVTLLKFIWSSTFEDVKNDFRYHNDHEMIYLALRLWNRNNQNDFFFTIMSNASANLKRDITTKPFFTEYCILLICKGKLAPLDRLLRFCFVELKDLKSFKRDLFKELLYTDRCNRLLKDKKFPNLDQLIESIFSDVVFGVLPINTSVLNNCKVIKDYCLACYKDEKVGCSNINKLLTIFLPSSPDTIAKFKRNLLMSSEGINECAQLIDSKVNLIPILIDSLPTNNLVTEFQERLIFSPVAVNKLRDVIKKKRLSDANQYIDRYLVKEEDKITLKKRIMGSQKRMIRKVFLKFDVPSWESVLTWLVPTEQARNEFKSEIPLDELFNEMLIDCIFAKFHNRANHNFNECRLKDDFSFGSLDRFLNWYFESDEIKIMKYKLTRWDSRDEIEAIRVARMWPNKGHAKAAVDWMFNL